MTARHTAIVIGAGQAGLSASFHLQRTGVEHVVLDAGDRVGDAWRQRWDSLRLFTPAAFDGLAGMPYPAAPSHFPTKDEMADYLEAYAERFALPVRTGVRVDGLARSGDLYRVSTAGETYEAEHVVVATGAHVAAHVPPFAADLAPAIRQLHSSAYRRLGQLRDGPVLVVGAGTSGVEIAIEAARGGHPTTLSGTSPRQVPKLARLGNGRLFFWLASKVLTTDTPMGRRARQGVTTGASPLIHTGVADVERAGVKRAPRTTAVRDGQPLLADGRTVDAANVIWCTGFRHDFSWIAVPILDERGEPRHIRGVATGQPGLYFLGLPFLYALTSALIGGVGRDAEHVVRRIVAAKAPRSQPVRSTVLA